MKSHILLILLCITLSCTKEVHVSMPMMHEEMYVLNSLFACNSPIQVYLTKTRTPYDSQEKIVKNAVIVVSSAHTIDTLITDISHLPQIAIFPDLSILVRQIQTF